MKLNQERKSKKKKVTNDAKAGKSQVLKWSRFAHSVQERVKEKRYMRSKKCWPGKKQSRQTF